jgi:hypothetical protein
MLNFEFFERVGNYFGFWILDVELFERAGSYFGF